MRPEYYGIKFYGVNDLTIGEHLERSAAILESFDKNEDYADINRVIELYNVQELINSGVSLKDWDEERINHYKQLCKPIMTILGKFFGKISDENFQQMYQSVC